MEIKGIEIKGCIFDLDGTILDSCLVWKEVDDNFFGKRGMKVPEGYAQAIMALGLEEAARYTKETYHFEESIPSIVDEWLSDVRHCYEKEVKLKDNAKKYLKKLYEAGIPLVIATANSSECYGPCIDRLGITKYFLGAYDVKGYKKGKCSPELFIKCAEDLNLLPEEILVFEDSIVPIKVAKEAGFKTCAVFEKTCLDEEKKEKEADIYIKDFKELF